MLNETEEETANDMGLKVFISYFKFVPFNYGNGNVYKMLWVGL